MASDVSGLTTQEAPSAAVVPSSSSRHMKAGTRRYWPNISPPKMPTVLPIRAWAASDEPAATTVPAPSFPTGRD